uniref:Uncharacterized protein n=1 Tax=Arundo donax TaxID=35708 RepID=A0A0A9HLQ1_ARUDO
MHEWSINLHTLSVTSVRARDLKLLPGCI